MLLSPAELDSLTQLIHRSPHSLLGLHPCAIGLVARAQVPDAVKVELVPTHEPKQPRFELKRLGDTCVFEGVTKAAKTVYAYDLVITDHDGRRRQNRDAYSFLPTLGEQDLHLFGEGNHRRLHDRLGGHLKVIDGVAGCAFAVWAPNARRVSVIGSFNNWDGRAHALRLLGPSGVWEIFIPGVGQGALYKFELLDAHGNLKVNTDPFGTFFELPPKHAAIVWDTGKFSWTDAAWLDRRAKTNALRAPMSIYELHLGSW